MFADVTNRFYSYKNIKGSFFTVNLELEKISLFYKNFFKDKTPI